MVTIPEPQIPTRFRNSCAFCGHVLDIRADGVHQHVSGWVKNRSGGGGHGISLAQRDPTKWAHGWCIDSAVRGFLKQPTLGI